MKLLRRQIRGSGEFADQLVGATSPMIGVGDIQIVTVIDVLKWFGCGIYVGGLD